jgi:hypothetical protein
MIGIYPQAGLIRRAFAHNDAQWWGSPQNDDSEPNNRLDDK